MVIYIYMYFFFHDRAKKKKKSKHKHKSHKRREMPRLKRQVYHDDEKNPDRSEWVPI